MELSSRVRYFSVVSLFSKIVFLCLLTGEMQDVSITKSSTQWCGKELQVSMRLINRLLPETTVNLQPLFSRLVSPTKSLLFAEALDWKTCASETSRSSTTTTTGNNENQIDFSTSAGRLRFRRNSSSVRNGSRNAAANGVNSGSVNGSIENISIFLSPDPPQANSPVELKLTMEAMRQIVHPVAYITGTYQTMWGFLEVPFEHALDYCSSEYITTVSTTEQQQSGNGSRCPVAPGKWDIAIDYDIPDIPFSGKMDMKIEIVDVAQEAGAHSIESKPETAIALACVTVNSRLMGSFLENS